MSELLTKYEQVEYRKWLDAVYPYDHASCGNCATQHSFDDCGEPEHSEMHAEAKRLGFTDRTQRNINPEMRKKVIAFRKKFAQFYGGKQP